MEVPIFGGLSECYSCNDTKARYESLRTAFNQQFGEEPEVYARAPGRVNLIGEHIDYEGYGVLPMAIKQDTIIAIRRGGTKLSISNLVSDKYPTHDFDTDPKQEVDTHNHTWANYFVCAYKGVHEMLEAKQLRTPEPCGLQVMIHGVVPLGGGLSSSSAFVCACFLAILGVHGIPIGKADVAEYAAQSERYVGVTSGGMDQAISMMAMQGVAKMIDFNPVRAADVVLPPGATFVVANSLAVSNKAEGAHKRYNLRVVECRLAAAMLAHALGAPKEFVASVKTLMELEPLLLDKCGGSGSGDVLELGAAAAAQHLHEAPYTHDEIETALGVSLENLYTGSAVSLKVIQVAKESDGFKLQQRAVHVYSEAGRVRKFKAVCDGDAPAGEKLSLLGSLMNGSHTSCSSLYECSCPELEELVGVAREAGALGARLTGAGWGGCTVSLVKEEEVEGFLQALKDKFYAKRVQAGAVGEGDLGNVLFASKPSSGAAILKLQPSAE